MARQRLSDVQGGFAGGLNTTADVSQLGETEVRSATNARLTEYGGVTKRRGSKRTHATALVAATIVRGGFSWERAASVQQLAVCGGKLFTGTYAIPMVWTDRGGTLSATAQVSFASFRDGAGEAVYIADGGPLNKWDGTTRTENLAGTPNVTRIWVYNQRLMGITGDSETIYWSALNNGDSLGVVASGGGSAVVRTFGDQSLTGGLVVGDFLAMFHKTGISVYSGWTQDDIQIETGSRGLSSDVGTTAPDTIVAVENVGFFLSDRGVYQVSGAGVESISGPIESVIAALDQSKFSRARAVHNNARREVLFYFPDVGVFAYNYRIRAWSGPWTGSYTDKIVYAAWSATDATNNPIVLWGGSDGFVRLTDPANVFLDDVLSDGTGGTAFIMSVQLRRMFFGKPAAEKALRYVYGIADVKGTSTIQIVSSTGTANVPIRVRGASVWGIGTWGEAVWGGLGSLSISEPAWGRGRFFDVTISDESAGESSYSRIELVGFDYGER